MAHVETAGTIVYRTALVPNPKYRQQPRGVYSAQLQREIERWNVPEMRTVHFDGTRSRSEEVNVDYGVRSAAFELRGTGRSTITYCKELRLVRFCVERPVERPVSDRPPHLEVLDETTTIAGLRCRKARYLGPREMHVWYSEEIAVDDPTGAVLAFDGVPGLVLQTEETADSESVETLRRVTVTELSFAAPDDAQLSAPAEYQPFPNVDAARDEERRQLDARPPTVPPETFAGAWFFETAHDTIRVDISAAAGQPAGLRFRTTVVSAPNEPAREEAAYQRADVLVVADPPNDRWYRVLGNALVEVGNGMFTFSRHPGATSR